MYIIRDIILVMVLGAPLFIILRILIKVNKAYLNKIHYVKDDRQNIRKEELKLIVFFIATLIVLFLMVFLIASVFMPTIILSIPIIIRVLIKIIILVIYGSFAAIFMGLGDVVGAGGSAREVIKTLSAYLSAAININDKKEGSGKKDGSGGQQF